MTRDLLIAHRAFAPRDLLRATVLVTASANVAGLSRRWLSMHCEAYRDQAANPVQIWANR
jgi:hypothetical protein